MAIDATSGGTDSDSFVTVEDADLYHNTRLHNSEWTSASTANKEAALKWATRILNDLQWLGRIADDAQALRWPRSNVYNRDGILLDDTTIPTFLEQATAEMAWRLIIEDNTVQSDLTGFRSLSLDGVGSITMKDGQISKTALERSVKDLIGYYVAGGYSQGVIRA